jgi:hypothetical protein
VSGVSADEVRQLGHKLSKPGVLLQQRVGFVGMFVTTTYRLISAKGIFK